MNEEEVYDTRPMSSFGAVLKKLEREGKFNELEDNDLRCEKCGRMACTKRNSSEGEICYGDNGCLGKLKSTVNVTAK